MVASIRTRRRCGHTAGWWWCWRWWCRTSARREPSESRRGKVSGVGGGEEEEEEEGGWLKTCQWCWWKEERDTEMRGCTDIKKKKASKLRRVLKHQIVVAERGARSQKQATAFERLRSSTTVAFKNGTVPVAARGVFFLDYFRQISRKAALTSVSSARRCLLPPDLPLLWLCAVVVLCFDKLVAQELLWRGRRGERPHGRFLFICSVCLGICLGNMEEWLHGHHATGPAATGCCCSGGHSAESMSFDYFAPVLQVWLLVCSLCTCLFGCFEAHAE